MGLSIFHPTDVSRCGASFRPPTFGYSLRIGPEVVPFGGLYLESYKVISKKELLRGLWVRPKGVSVFFLWEQSMPGKSRQGGSHPKPEAVRISRVPPPPPLAVALCSSSSSN